MITLKNDSYFFQFSHNVILQRASVRIQMCILNCFMSLKAASPIDGSFIFFPSFLVTICCNN